MSLNVNTVILAGHLTRDPQLRSVGNEKTVASFGLAINRRFKAGDGETKEEVTFVDVECWGRTAEVVGQYCAKGAPLYIEGRLKLDTWEDKDGTKRSKLKVVADTVQLMGNKNDTATRGSAANPPPSHEKRNPGAAEPIASGPRPGADEPPF
jgi:single-strand DNA-binding protein